MPVELPNIDPKRELARKLAESVFAQIPIVGGPFVAILSVTQRSDAEKKLAAWREHMTGSVNNLEEVIADLLPTIKLSKDAAALGLWVSKTSPQGRTDPMVFGTIQEAFPDAAKIELEDACGELELAGLVMLSAASGHRIRLLRPTAHLFRVFDPVAFEGSNPRVDAAALARFILKDDRNGNASAILEHFGWTVRRFNPAMAVICEMVSEGRRSGEMHPEYACRFVIPNPTERAELKLYADRVLGDVD